MSIASKVQEEAFFQGDLEAFDSQEPRPKSLWPVFCSPASVYFLQQRYAVGLFVQSLFLLGFVLFWLSSNALELFHFQSLFAWLLFSSILWLLLILKNLPSQARWVHRKEHGFLALVSFWLPMLLLSSLLLNLTAQRSLMANDSMEPNIYQGDVVLIDYSAYLWSEPKYGDIVVIEDEAWEGKERRKRVAIARIIAKPGDSIQVRNKRPIRNGQMLLQKVPKAESFVYPKVKGLAFEITSAEDGEGAEPKRWYPVITAADLLYRNFEQITLDAESYFVLADNRGADPRRGSATAQGYVVSVREIKGQVRFVFYNAYRDFFERFALRLR